MRAYRILFACLLMLVAAASAQAQQPLEHVRLQLMWRHQFQFAGYYMALAKGFYREVGLDVELVEAEPDLVPVDEVLSGRSQFAVGRSSLLLDRLHGRDVVALMAAFQRSPLMLLTRADSAIADPAALRGKRIMMTEDAVKVAEILAMLLKFGVTPDDVVIQKPSYDIMDLVEDRTDAVASYVSNEPYQMEQLGIAYNQIHPKDYGFQMYSDILFTSGELADHRFEMVRNFEQASRRGWLYAFNHIEEAADLILARYNTQHRTRDALIFEAKALRELAFDDQGQFGSLNLDRFAAMASVYRITSNIAPTAGLQGMLLCCTASAAFDLTPSQRHYLRNLGPIRLCVNRDWEPLQNVQEEQQSGLLADYVGHIFNRIGLEYRVVGSDSWQQSRVLLANNQCDLIAGMMSIVPTRDRLFFSRPFVTLPIVAALREGDSIDHPRQLSQPIGVLRQHDLDHLLLRRYPELKVRTVASVADGLRLVQQGELSAFVDTRFTIERGMREAGISGLSLDPSLSDSFDLGFAADNKDQPLIRLLDRAIGDLRPGEREEILERWTPVKQKTVMDHTLVRNLLIGVAVLSALAGYRFYLVSVTNRRLERMAREDSLTGISNRRRVSEQFDAAINLAERSGIPLALIYFDIDDFKHINDSFGHARGDDVLVEVVARVREHIRRTDGFGRWGGEEFLVLLQDTDLVGAARLAEKLRASIAEGVRIDGQGVTCSFGIAQWHNGENQDQLVSRADSALYLAKHRGKNRVETDKNHNIGKNS